MVRDFVCQLTELQVSVSIFNHFTQLDTPDTVRMA
jgi:hypothetical protein